MAFPLRVLSLGVLASLASSSWSPAAVSARQRDPVMAGPVLVSPSANRARPQKRELPPLTRVASRSGRNLPETRRVYTDYGYESGADGSSVERQIVALVDAERARRGLSSLSLDPVLTQAARLHSRNMAAAGFFDHYAPTRSLRTPTERYRAVAGPRDTPRIGENIFRSSGMSPTAGRRAHDAFMRSSGHRENVLRRDYRRIGIGVHVGEDGQFWVTEMFSD